MKNILLFFWRKIASIIRKLVALNMEWDDVVKCFTPHSVDTVILGDLFEYLGKSEAKLLLDKTIQIAKQQVILYTPLGFMPQFHENEKGA